MDSAYKVQLPIFEGPLDLLLDLIEQRKLLINDISLAKVTDDYLAHIKEQGNFSLPGAAHFILVASTLLLIRSRSLLPSLALAEEEEELAHSLWSDLIRCFNNPLQVVYYIA